jgi:lysophospholipase L1-like esterase
MYFGKKTCRVYLALFVITSLVFAGCGGVSESLREEEKVADGKSGLKENAVILFIGDSITDGGRNYNDPASLGSNMPAHFSRLMKSGFPGENVTVYNKGIAGDQAIDVYLRLKEDCYDLDPDYIFLQVGVNDAWNGYEGKKAFEKIYREILLGIKANTHAELVISEPCLLEADDGMQKASVIPNVNSYLRKVWEMRDVVRGLASELDVSIIYLDEIYNQQIKKKTPPAEIANDAIHPASKGMIILMEQIYRKLNIPGVKYTYGPYDVSNIENSFRKEKTAAPEPELFDPVPAGSGFCALGALDEKIKTARVLLETGEVVDVQYAGSAVKPGSVYFYSVQDGVYSFSEPAWTSHDEGAGSLPFQANNRSRRLTRMKTYFVHPEAVFFVRYSDYQWRVFRGRNVMPCKNYAVEIMESHGNIFGVKVMNTSYLAALCVMVTGGSFDNGLWPPANAETTKFFDLAGRGFPAGDKELK